MSEGMLEGTSERMRDGIAERHCRIENPDYR